MGFNELKYVKEAFDSNWIAPVGPHLNKFESKISEYLSSSEVNFSLALSSGTAAIHLALISLGVKKNDIVLVQSLTFCGSVNPVKYIGATPVFIDSEAETWNMCPQELENAIVKIGKKKIKAIIVVHLYGMPAKMNEITEISKKFEIPLIEDAAEALGSSYSEKKCGSFGAASILSFNGNKIITTSSGGALISKDKNIIDFCRKLSTQARDEAPHYEHSVIGYNYRLSNVLAGIGLGQLEILDNRVKKRRNNFFKYKNFFQPIDGIKFQDEPNKLFHSNYWITAILNVLNNRDLNKLRLELEKENIESRPIWKPMHMQPVFKNHDFYGPGICKSIFENGLCLPSGSNLTESDFDRIFSVIKFFFR